MQKNGIVFSKNGSSFSTFSRPPAALVNIYGYSSHPLDGPIPRDYLCECLESTLLIRTRNNMYQFGTHDKNTYLCREIANEMVVVSSREFRANQRKYFALALSNDVVITSRTHGSYRLVPVSENDLLIDRAALDAKIRQGIADYESGKENRMKEGETSEEFIARMISEA